MTKKINKYQLLELICIFIITLIFNLVCSEMLHDEVWNYGFAYNIANGLIPYKDFNMVVTPLFPILGAMFMMIFGKNIIIYHIFNTIICTLLFLNIKKQTPEAYYIIYAIILFYSLSMPHYNLLCILLTYILINLEKREDKDYLIGILLGLIFISKQSIGICLCIPSLLIKDKKRIWKRIIGFLTIVSIMIAYLTYKRALYQFIDYCFLGLIDFGKENKYNHPLFFVIPIISIIYLISEYIKHKDFTILYMILIFSMAYPIFDLYHTGLPAIITLGYFLNKLKLNKIIISCSFIIFIISVFTYNIFQYNSNNFSYPNNTRTYKYRKINNDIVNNTNTITNYIENSPNKVFIIDTYAYLIKLNTNIPITKYDLLNNGNLGKAGQAKIVSEINTICKKEKCDFLLDKYAATHPKYTQYNQEIYKYIIDNYKEDGKILGLSIYKNY